jgi:hypothetical protein
MYKNDLNVLDEVNKGATMGMDAIEFVEKKVGDEKFRDVLNSEYSKYQEISNRVNDLYAKFPTNKGPHETSAMTKVMTWWGVQMKAMTDQSNSNISELLLNGTNMGIIEGRRLINQNPDISQDIHTLLCDFVKLQENSVEELKNFL